MKTLKDMKPKEVLMHLRERIRRILGDSVENASQIYAHHGYFFVMVPGYFDGDTQTLRRWQIPAYLKALKREAK